MDLTGANILVTGGTGFVGSHLVEKLLVLKANVITTYQSNNPHSYFNTQKLADKVTKMDIDVRNFGQLFDIVTKFKVDYIFHLAAQPLVEVAFYNPKSTLESNIMGTVNIMEAARLHPRIKGIIVASSDKAYGKSMKNKYIEDDPLRGDHPYEVSKLAADLIAYSYFRTYGLPVTITRFGNIYGEGDLNFCRIIPGIMKSLITDETLEIRSDGTFVRDYLNVKDVVDGYLMLADHIQQTKGQAYNFGSKDTLSVLGVIKIVERTLKLKVNYQIINNAKNEIPFQSLDYSKIKNQLNWSPLRNIVKSLPTIYSWYKRIF